MLATWSRARHTRAACGCIQCVSLARPTAWSVVQRRWLEQRASVSSSPRNSSARLAADARAKHVGSEQWDKAFAQLKEALDGSQQQASLTPETGGAAATHLPPPPPPSDHAATALEDMLRTDYDWSAFRRIIGMDLIDDHVLREQEVESLSQSHAHIDIAATPWDHLYLSSFAFDATPPDWLANTGLNVVLKNLPPQSLWAPSTLRLAAMRRRHTWKKLALQRLSAALLICTLLQYAKLSRFSTSQPASLAKMLPQLRDIALRDEAQMHTLRTHLRQEIDKLHQTPVDASEDEVASAMQRLNRPEIPHYYQDADGDFHNVTRSMNEGIIKQVLQKKPSHRGQTEAFAIADICHNLFVSTAPPNVATFNSLLTGFRKWRRPRLIDHVIGALYLHKIRPNEVTCVEILTHYTLQSRPDDFSRFVARMRGASDALMLANPSVTINEASFGRLVRLNQRKVLQKVHPTPMVFQALLHGVLHFAGFERTLDVYYDMKADGWGLDVPGLVSLLSQCISRADWEGGLYIWEEINSIKMRSRPVDVASAYHHMLSLCSVTGKTTAFNQILNEVARRGFNRKSIIDAATKLTHWVHKSSPALAPAFAADNVLIAVSEYLDDAKATKGAAASKNDGNTTFPDLHYKNDNLRTSAGNIESEPPSTSPAEAWSSWVEHEFGERPKDPEL